MPEGSGPRMLGVGRRGSTVIVSLVILTFLLVVPAASAQTTGTVTGVLGASSGGVLPGVSVVARHVDTGLARTTAGQVVRAARRSSRIQDADLYGHHPANFGPPALIAFAGNADGEAPLASFGRIRTTVTSARQVQLGIRIAL